MSLDMHIGTDVTSASKELPLLSLSEMEHALIFAKCSIENHKLLYRLNDYYSDAIYTTDEVNSLLAELEEIEIICKDNTTHNHIMKLMEVCKEAQRNNQNVYFFAD